MCAPIPVVVLVFMKSDYPYLENYINNEPVIINSS